MEKLTLSKTFYLVTLMLCCCFISVTIGIAWGTTAAAAGPASFMLGVFTIAFAFMSVWANAVE